MRNRVVEALEGLWFVVLGVGGILAMTAVIVLPMLGLYLMFGDDAEATLGVVLLGVFAVGTVGAIVTGVLRRD